MLISVNKTASAWKQNITHIKKKGKYALRWQEKKDTLSPTATTERHKRGKRMLRRQKSIFSSSKLKQKEQQLTQYLECQFHKAQDYTALQISRDDTRVRRHMNSSRSLNHVLGKREMPPHFYANILVLKFSLSLACLQKFGLSVLFFHRSLLININCKTSLIRALS